MLTPQPQCATHKVWNWKSNFVWIPSKPPWQRSSRLSSANNVISLYRAANVDTRRLVGFTTSPFTRVPSSVYPSLGFLHENQAQLGLWQWVWPNTICVSRCGWLVGRSHFRISIRLMSLDPHRALVDHGISYILWKVCQKCFFLAAVQPVAWTGQHSQFLRCFNVYFSKYTPLLSFGNNYL